MGLKILGLKCPSNDLKILHDVIICGLRNGTIEIWNKKTLKKELSLEDQHGSVQVSPNFNSASPSERCLEKQNYPLRSNLVVWCAKIGPQTQKLQKTKHPFVVFRVISEVQRINNDLGLILAHQTTAIPRDTLPLDMLTPQIRHYELWQKNSRYANFSDLSTPSYAIFDQ